MVFQKLKKTLQERRSELYSVKSHRGVRRDTKVSFRFGDDQVTGG